MQYVCELLILMLRPRKGVSCIFVFRSSELNRKKRIVLCLLQNKAVSMLVCKSHFLLCVWAVYILKQRFVPNGKACDVNTQITFTPGCKCQYFFFRSNTFVPQCTTVSFINHL